MNFLKWRKSLPMPTATQTVPPQQAVPQMTATQMQLQYQMLRSQLMIKPLFQQKAEDTSLDYPKILASIPSGSRVICDPPVMDTDEDTFILVDRYPSNARMEMDGWTKCDSRDMYHMGPIRAFRKGTKNWIFTTNKIYYIQTAAATALAKQLNLTKKEDRMSLFALLQGQYVDYDGPMPDKGFL